jgi:hypothetical protein
MDIVSTKRAATTFEVIPEIDEDEILEELN